VSIASFPILLAPGETRWWYRITKLADAEAAARDYLNGLALPLREKGLTVQCVTLIGFPPESIVSYAEENRFDLVVMATHGCSGLGRLVWAALPSMSSRSRGCPLC